MSEATSPADVQLERTLTGGVLKLTFARPEKKNAFTVRMYEECAAALNAAATDTAVRCVLFTGKGSAFTSGNDLVDFMNAPPAGEDSAVFRFLLALIDFEKPIIAAVNGAAIGIGVTMLLHCDLVYAADSARFTTPFVALGLVPEGASSLLVPRAAGFAAANEMLLLGEPVDAAFAKDAGIVARVLPAAELLPFAVAQANKLAALAPAALRQSKALIRGPQKEAVKRALYEEAKVFLARLSSPEAIEAFTAFFEKRKPDFSRFT